VGAQIVPGAAGPRWYVDALRARREDARLTVDGCPISVRCWGSSDNPVAILVHGAAAHAGWWDHVAPLLRQGYQVVAPDLSGHGDSGWRVSYSLESWGAEVLHVARAFDTPGQGAVLIGHSLGGWVAAVATALDPSAVAGTITIDTSLAEPTPERHASRQRRAQAPLRMYPTKEAALKHFRPLPTQDGVQDFVAAHIARQSVRLYDEGWSWKFDPGVFARHHPGLDLFLNFSGKLAMLRAEHGLAADPVSLDIYEQMRDKALVIDLPDTGHHAMLDHPLALVTTLRSLLEMWRPDAPTNGVSVAASSAGIQRSTIR